MADNPSRPVDSPIKVTTAGGWQPNQWIHEASGTKNTGVQPVPKLVSVEEQQITNNTKVRKTKIVDQSIADALNKDLKKRNLKK